MRRNLLKQFMLTLSFFLLGGAEAWADIDFGDEATVSTKKIWNFDDLETSTQYSTYTEIDGLYLRTIATGRSFTVKEGNASLIFSNANKDDVGKYLYINNSASYSGENALLATSTAGDTKNTGTGMIAVNASVAGTFYVKIKGGTSEKVIRMYFVNGTSILNKSVTTDGTIQEISYTSEEAGSFFVGGLTTGSSEIYEARFIPSSILVSEEKTWLFDDFAVMTFNSREVVNLENGLFARAKTQDMSIQAQEACSSWTFADGHSENSISQCLVLGNLANNDSEKGDSKPFNNTKYKDGSIAFEAGVPGKLYVVASHSGGNIRVQNADGGNILNTSISETPHEYSTIVSIGTYYIAVTSASAKVYAIRFVPETVTTPTIRNNNGMITITPGVSSIDATVKTYYTIDGSEPNASSYEYTAPFTQATAATIKAITISQSSGATASDISEPKAVHTIPTELTSNNISFANISEEQVVKDDNENFTVSDVDLGKQYQVNSAGASSIYTKGVIFNYTSKSGAKITLNSNFLNLGSAGVAITIPAMTVNQYVIVKYSTVSNDHVPSLSCSNGKVISNPSSTSATSSESATVSFVAQSNGGDMIINVADYGIRLFRIIVANTLATSVADGQTEWGNASITTSPLVAETNYFTKGSSVTVTATPNEGYQFVNWKNGETTVSTEAAYTFDISENLNLTANFKKADLTLTDGSGEHGTLSFKKGEAPVTVAQVGDEVTIVVAPATGYKLQEGTLAANYNDGEAKVAAINDNKFTMPAYPINVAATFETISYNINYDLAEGAVESANPTSYTVETESFTLNNPTKAGCTFAGWKLNGEGDPLTTVTIAQGTTGNLSYTATWTTDTYSITLPASENGNSVTADKTTGIESGETITLSITTGDDYVLTSIYADRVEFKVVGDNRTFTMPDMNVEIKAVFTKKTAENSDKLATVDADIVSDGNATITNVEPESTTNTTTISISGEVNGTSVTAIAAGAFESLSDSQVQSVDLSSTSVSLTGDRSTNAVLKDIPATALIYLPNSSSGVTGDNVVIKTGTDTYSCTNFVMEGGNTTGKSYSVPKAFTATNVSLNREFDENVAATVCLPYALTQEQANALGKFYYFSSVTGNTVNMTQVTTGGLESNKPYMFLPNSTVGTNNSLTASSVDVSIANSQTSSETGGSAFTFQGVIADKTFTTDEIAGGIYGFAAEADHGASSVGQFVKCSNGAYVKAFRAYLICATNLTGEQHPAGARGLGESEALPDVLYVTLINGDGSTTSIGKLELIEIDDTMPRYNLSGQRVGKDYKGIVIINGKKMFIK